MKSSETGGGVVVNNGKVVLVQQSEAIWSLPKGHMEEGESVLEAAKREIYEEAGLKELEFVRELGSYQRYRGGKTPDTVDTSQLKTIHVFLFKTTETKLQPQEENTLDAKWVPIDGVYDALSYPKDKEFYKSIIDQIA